MLSCVFDIFSATTEDSWSMKRTLPDQNLDDQILVAFFKSGVTNRIFASEVCLLFIHIMRKTKKKNQLKKSCLASKNQIKLFL